MILVYILLIVWLIFWLVPLVLKWVLRRGARRVQRTIFEQMGIDPSLYEQMRQAQSSERQEAASSHSRSRRSNGRRSPSTRIIPTEYAETITFVQLAIDGTEAWLDPSGSPIFTEYRHETQITDVKWTLVQ